MFYKRYIFWIFIYFFYFSTKLFGFLDGIFGFLDGIFWISRRNFFGLLFSPKKTIFGGEHFLTFCRWCTNRCWTILPPFLWVGGVAPEIRYELVTFWCYSALKTIFCFFLGFCSNQLDPPPPPESWDSKKWKKNY